jgi:HEAT repeat protein
VNGLTALGIKEQLPAVERALGDPSGPVRLAAVRGVYRLAGAAGAVSLVRMFSDELEDVRRRAVACVGWLGQGNLARDVVPLLRYESASVRLAALEALGNLKSPTVVDEVIGLLDDPEEPVQRKAYQALRTITGKQMGQAFPEDQDGRRFLIARWRAWREENPLLSAG